MRNLLVILAAIAVVACASFASACPVAVQSAVVAPVYQQSFAVAAPSYSACNNAVAVQAVAPVAVQSYAVPSVAFQAVAVQPVLVEQVNVHHAHHVQRRSVSVTRTVVRH